MIIGIDAGCLGINDNRLKVGVYRMSTDLLSELFRIDKKNNYKLYSFLPIEKNLLRKFGSRVENKIIKPAFGWFKIWLPLELKKNPVDVFIGLSQSLPKLSGKTKGIVFIHDLTFEQYPGWFANSYQKMSENTKFALDSATKIITVSRATKRDLLKKYPKIPQDKICIIYEGLSKRFINKPLAKSAKIMEKLGISKPFLLFVGTLKPSKNVPNIIKAFGRFIKSGYDYQLVIVGSSYWMDQEIIETINNLNPQKRIKMLGFVSDKVLQLLYSKASLFVSPSFNEGFGLTHLEAASFGIPIITAKRGSIEEVLDQGAYYVNPSDSEGIALAFKNVLTNKKLSDKITRLAKINIKKFTWKKSARQVLNLLNGYEKNRLNLS